MSKLAISTITTSDWKYEDILRHYPQVEGLDGIGFWQDVLRGQKSADVRRQVTDAGLEISGLYFVGGFTKDLSAKLEEARRGVDQAHELGTKNLLFLSGPVTEEVDKYAALDTAKQAVAELQPYCAEAGVTLCVEPLHPIMMGKYGMLATVAQATEVMRAAPGSKLCFDTWNSWWEVGIEDWLRDRVGDIAWVHLCDWKGGQESKPMNREVPGRGVAPLSTMVNILKEGGFDGWYDVELMTDEYRASDYPELLRRCVAGSRALL